MTKDKNSMRTACFSLVWKGYNSEKERQQGIGIMYRCLCTKCVGWSTEGDKSFQFQHWPLMKTLSVQPCPEPSLTSIAWAPGRAEKGRVIREAPGRKAPWKCTLGSCAVLWTPYPQRDGPISVDCT